MCRGTMAEGILVSGDETEGTHLNASPLYMAADSTGYMFQHYESAGLNLVVVGFAILVFDAGPGST